MMNFSILLSILILNIISYKMFQMFPFFQNHKLEEINKITGPVFLARLKRDKKVIYLFGDIHYKLDKQTACSSVINTNEMELNLYLQYIFSEKFKKNEKINFFLEDTLNNTNKVVVSHKKYSYISSLRMLFTKKFDNVTYIPFDGRLVKKTPLALYTENIQHIWVNHNIYFIELICFIGLSFTWPSLLTILYKRTKEGDKNGEKSSKCFSFLKIFLYSIYILFSIFSITYLIYLIILYIKFVKSKNDFLMSHQEADFTKKIFGSKNKEVREEYNSIIEIMKGTNDLRTLFLCCAFIIDLYHIDVLLDTNINLNYSYSGLYHTQHIIYFLIKKCNFELTHTTGITGVVKDDKNAVEDDKNATYLDRDDLVARSESYDLQKYLFSPTKYPPLEKYYIQCIDISNFPFLLS